MFEVFPHTADLGLHIVAPDLNALFEEAGRGFFSVVTANLDAVEPRTSVEFHIQGGDPAYLLVDWLNELLYALDSKRLLLRDFAVTVDADGLRARAAGETIDESRHLLEHEVKAITYHGLSVNKVGNAWSADVILDI